MMNKHDNSELGGGRRKDRKKVLIPEDRKLFFSLVSLLIDPTLLPIDSEMPSEVEEFMKFIPEEKHDLVAKLRDTLQWD
jgi:hypothetical protein